MKAWGIWLGTILVGIALIAALVATWLWNNLKSEWDAESATGQYALNHSPLSTISKHDVFTGNGAEEVFQGKDSFGRSWYVMVFGNPTQLRSIQVSAVQTKQAVVKTAKADGLQVISEHIGYLDTAGQNQLGTNASFVWEVYGKTEQGKYEYAYFDATTGKLIQSY